MRAFWLLPLLLPACAPQDTVQLGAPPRGGDKADGAGFVRLEVAKLEQSQLLATVTAGPEARQTGVMFREGQGGAAGDWQQADGVPGDAPDADGNLAYAVTSQPLQPETRWVQLAAFAVDENGSASWDDGGGNHYFRFATPDGSPLWDLAPSREERGLALSALTVSLGDEKVFIRYSVDGGHTTIKLPMRQVSTDELDDTYQILLREVGPQVTSLRYSLEVVSPDGFVIRTDERELTLPQ